MTGPLLTASAERLAAALVGKTIGDMESVGHLTAMEIAETLLASGAVVPAASLAADWNCVDEGSCADGDHTLTPPCMFAARGRVR